MVYKKTNLFVLKSFFFVYHFLKGQQVKHFLKGRQVSLFLKEGFPNKNTIFVTAFPKVFQRFSRGKLTKTTGQIRKLTCPFFFQGLWDRLENLPVPFFFFKVNKRDGFKKTFGKVLDTIGIFFLILSGS